MLIESLCVQMYLLFEFKRNFEFRNHFLIIFLRQLSLIVLSERRILKR